MTLALILSVAAMIGIVTFRYLAVSGGFAWLTQRRLPELYRGRGAQMRSEILWSLSGALIYAAVPREDRFCLPNTRFLLHQPAGGVRGVGSDVAIAAEQIIRMRARLNRLFAAATGQAVEKIEADTNRDFWMDAETARDYGLVGHIIECADELDATP